MMSIRRVSQLLLPGYVVLLTILTLLPSSSMPAVDLWDKAQHFIAYSLLPPLSMLAVSSIRSLHYLCLLWAGYGIALEYAQSIVPGRTTSWEDALANSLGIVCGLLLSHCAQKCYRRHHAQPD